MSEIDAQAIQEAMDQMVEAFQSFMDALSEILKPILKAIRKWYEDITRHLLVYRLHKSHVPFEVSLFLSKHWPRKWLPYKWAWSMLM